MSDIFREVEEDVRRERFARLWKKYGTHAIVLLVLAFVALGAWQLWQRHVRAEQEKSALAFIAAQRITDPRQAATAFSDLAKDATPGYAQLARLSQADAMFAAGQRKDAIDLYKQIAAGDNGAVGAMARLRAAWAMAENASRADLARLLAPLDEKGSSWRTLAEEVLAFADYRALDMKAAAARYMALEKDPEAPDALRARARAMAAFLKNGGAITFGTVPPDTLPAPATAAAAAANTPAKPAAPAK